MATASAIEFQDEKFIGLGLSKTVVNKEKISTYSRSLGAVSESNPILVLIHGYPQSAYEWRHLIPLLPLNAPIFAVDLPGYGGSGLVEQNDKLTVGTTLLEALKTEVKRSPSNSSSSRDVPVILIGHDRGARVTHHLTLEGVKGIDVRGVCIIDIVPTALQWQHFSDPVTQAKEVTGWFHWPFLANVDLSMRMITAFGRANWCKEMMLRWAGSNTAGLERLKSDNALDVYGAFMEQEHTLKASCEDYEHGAKLDIQREVEWQKDGKKIKVPVLLLYSQHYLGRRYTFPDVWKDWIMEGVKVESHGWGNGIGHFGLEEAPEESAKVIGEWLKGL